MAKRQFDARQIRQSVGSINHDGVSRCAFCIFLHQRSLCLFCLCCLCVQVASPASLNTGRNVYPTVDAYLQFKLHQFAAVVLGLLCFRNLNLGLVDLRRLEVKQSSFFEEFNLLVHFDPP